MYNTWHIAIIKIRNCGKAITKVSRVFNITISEMTNFLAFFDTLSFYSCCLNDFTFGLNV